MQQVEVEEYEVQTAILELMLDKRVWSNAALKRELETKLDLSEYDKRGSNSRANEPAWYNKVNNALSRSRSNSLTAKGYVTSTGHGEHQLTKAGEQYYREEKSGLDKMRSNFQAEADKNPMLQRLIKK